MHRNVGSRKRLTCNCEKSAADYQHDNAYRADNVINYIFIKIEFDKSFYAVRNIADLFTDIIADNNRKLELTVYNISE